MGILIALAAIGLVAFLALKQKKKNELEANAHTEFPIRKAWTITVLCISVMQAPITYYYSFGFVSIIQIVVYSMILLMFASALVGSFIKSRRITGFHWYGAASVVIFGIASLIFGLDIVEKLDWQLRKQERQLIVDRYIDGRHNGCKVKLNCFPPISNGGNEIFIDGGISSGVTIEFLIDRGFLDHYSAFVYTTDPDMILAFDARVKSEWSKTNWKISENWYRISK